MPGSIVAAALMALLAVPGSFAGAQALNARERAREPYTQGLDYMRAERYDAAARAFESAIAIDPEFELAHYQLGRVHLVQRNYVSAIYALAKSRDLYVAQGSRRFADRQASDRVRRERMGEMDDLIGRLRLIVPQTIQIQEQIRQLQERKRQIEDMDREAGLSPDKAVPAFVSLSLGSAYFRAGRLPEAEQAYLAALAADSRVGEAHNNLAVVYMETGRLDAAEHAVRAAEKAGLRVAPALKDEIRKRKRGGTLARSGRGQREPNS
jgi:Tfp pilus assembly protein PilF